MSHKILTPEECKCNKDETNCPICDGGLSLCIICSGVEGELPTDCPGTPMGWLQKEKILQGELDFVAGSWINQSTSVTREKRQTKAGVVGD